MTPAGLEAAPQARIVTATEPTPDQLATWQRLWTLLLAPEQNSPTPAAPTGTGAQNAAAAPANEAGAAAAPCARASTHESGVTDET